MDVSELVSRKRKKPHLKKKRENPIIITFDENARREFLTGFHKRKVQRKHKALEEFEKQLKIEKKRIKTETKEAFKKLLLLQKPIPELNLHSEEIDMGTHSVTVTELSATALAKNNNWIGANEVMYEKPEYEMRPHDSDNASELEGMDIKSTQKKEGRKAYLKSCKDVKKMIQKQATLNVKTSEIFKKKSKIEKIRQIKKKKKEEKKRRKLKKQKMLSNQ